MPNNTKPDDCFESNEALEAFRESELGKTIPAAYEATDVRREICDVLFPLNPEVVPLRRAHEASRYDYNQYCI